MDFNFISMCFRGDSGIHGKRLQEGVRRISEGLVEVPGEFWKFQKIFRREIKEFQEFHRDLRGFRGL